jgi:hypothetical protein
MVADSAQADGRLAWQAFRRVTLRLSSYSVSNHIDPFSSVIDATSDFPEVRPLFFSDISV